MRLTLRMLLAYLDDTLEPAETKAIGQRIAESSTAQELISRIKMVTRRRRLGSPPTGAAGTKFDPEIVAAYLDGTLAEEKAAEIEKQCLDSDVHLAEIAACHQIQTLLSGEPALVPGPARQRMYTLVRGREAIRNRKVPGSSPGRRVAEQLGPDVRTEDEDSLLGIPQYRRQPGWLRWALPVGALVLLVGVSFAIWQALSGPSSKGNPSSNRQVASAASTSLAPATDKGDGKKPEDTTAPDGSGANAKPPDSTTPPDTTIAPPTVPPVNTPPDMPPVTTTPPATVPVSTGPWVDKPNNERGPAGKVQALAEKNVIPLLIRRPEGVSGKEAWQGWQRVPAGGPVSTGESLVALPGYRASVLFDKGVELYLWGNVPFVQLYHLPLYESDVTVHKSDKYDLDLTYRAGRILLTNRKPNGPATVRLRFYDEPERKEAWDVTLQDPNTTVGLELLGRYPPGTPFRAPAQPASGRIRTGPTGQPDAASSASPPLPPLVDLYMVVISGRASVKVDEYRSWNDMGELPNGQPGPSLLEWNNYGQGAQRPLPIGPDAKKKFWDKSLPNDNNPARDRFVAALESLEKGISTRPAVEVAILERLDNAQKENRIVAIYALGSIDDVPRLIEALADVQPNHGDVPQTAFVTLQQWIGQGSRYETKLFELLQKKYKKVEAETIMQLLHGYPMSARTQEATILALVGYLKHTKPAIRQLAYMNLYTIVPEGRTIKYNPIGDQVQLDAGYKEWKKLAVDQKLPANPPAPPGSGPG